MRWQAKVTGLKDRPDDKPPAGWTARGERGAWQPVCLDGEGNERRILWRRLLRPRKASKKREGPAWVPVSLPKGVAPGSFVEAMLDVLEAVTGRRPAPARAKTAVSPVMALWTALGRPPLDEFVVDYRLVAKAARECSDGIFAKDIRGGGQQDGVDRSRSPATLSVQSRWDERLAVARKWVRPRKTQPDAPVEDGPVPKMEF